MTGRPARAPIAGRTIEPNGIDVRHRVERQAAGALRGVVTEPERDDPVADLVEDDRDDEAAEEDERLAEGHRRSGRGRQRDFDAQAMQRRAAGFASSRACGDLAPAGLAPAVGAGVELRERVLDLVERVGERARRAPRSRPARRSPGSSRRSPRRSAGRRRRRRAPGAASRRRSRSSWSWARSTGVVRRPTMPPCVPVRRRSSGPGRQGPTGCVTGSRGPADGRAVVDRPQPLGRHLRVHLGGRDARVARGPPGRPGCRHRGRAGGSRTSGGARAGAHGRRGPARRPASRTIPQHPCRVSRPPRALRKTASPARRQRAPPPVELGTAPRRGSRRAPPAPAGRSARSAPWRPCRRRARARRRGRGRRGRAPTSSVIRTPPA